MAERARRARPRRGRRRRFVALGRELNFFIYDVIKITILLCTLIFVISYIQSYFPPERSRRIMGRFHGIWANCAAALLGTVTPFCSCSSIPLFIGFTSAGLPLGVTFSFLISSPMVDLGSLVILTGIFGARVAAAYVALGLVIAVAGGALIEKMRMDGYVEDFIRQVKGAETEAAEPSVRERLIYAKGQTVFTFRKVFPYILLASGSGRSSTTGCRRAGLKASSAEAIRSGWCSRLLSAFRCTAIFSGLFLWRKLCFIRGRCSARC